MIIQWRKSGPTELVALWQGHSLSLQFSPTPTRAPWIVSVDGLRVTTTDQGAAPASWWTSLAAMEAVDAVAQRLVMRASATAHAAQRARSGERIVRHGL